MIAFPSMLLAPAEKAGIPVPSKEKLDSKEGFDEKKYLRFHIFCCVQLGQSMPDAHSHWDNAHVIAQIPEEKLKSITFGELIEMGLRIST